MQDKPLVIITTFNRENCYKRLSTSIDQNEVDVLVCACGQRDNPYNPYDSFVGVDTILFENKEPVVVLKDEGFKYAQENNYEHVFIIEDDVIIKDNTVWGYFIEFSRVSGIFHTNWNSADKNKKIKDYQINEHIKASIHQNAQGCFQYFNKSIFNHVRWDRSYINAFEHGDVEYSLSLDGVIPPFWANVSPYGLEEYLEYDDGGESTITNKEDYSNNIIQSLNHWVNKWGKKPSDIPVTPIDKVMRSINRIQKQYGEVTPTNIKYKPVSIIVTLKNRCDIKYKTNNDLLPLELATMKQHDGVISKVWNSNKDRDGIEYNLLHLQRNNFRLFDNFLKTVNEQVHNFNGKVELIVSDWGSDDDNIQDVIESFWDFEYTIVNLPKDEKFSRGFGLDQSIKLSKYDHLHLTDVDMTYRTPKFLIECSQLDRTAIFPTIAKQVTPSGLFLYMECAGFGIASLERSVYNESGGFDDIRKWGGEDANLFERVDKLLGKENVKRTMYPECIHSWHTDKGRN